MMVTFCWLFAYSQKLSAEYAEYLRKRRQIQNACEIVKAKSILVNRGRVKVLNKRSRFLKGTTMNGIQDWHWVYCQRCLLTTNRSRDARVLQFYITNCGHTFCEQCAGTGLSQQCFLCGRSGPKTMVVNQQLRGDMQLSCQNISASFATLTQAYTFHRR